MGLSCNGAQAVPPDRALPPHQPGFRGRPGDEVGLKLLLALTRVQTPASSQEVSLRMFLSSTSRGQPGDTVQGRRRLQKQQGPGQNHALGREPRSGSGIVHKPLLTVTPGPVLSACVAGISNKASDVLTLYAASSH